eukprot:TRINITY_DN10739_c0_g1_i1.p1 TRINITY_DN10739_c0_g1~~TRINITY_DN10739_c0_g1_i1.p1  ORF type:complete len:329 (+),score=73.14 TRINITY_DN10739_c0_g1_i1:45-989(+)
MSLICSNPNCKAENSFVQDEDRGSIICRECGRVKADRIIDQGSEWRNFQESDGDNARAQKVDGFSEGHLSTSVTSKVLGAPKGTRGDKAMSDLLRRTHMDANTKNLVKGNGRLRELCAQLGFHESVLTQAKNIYSKFINEKKTTVRNVASDQMFLAILYLALKEEDVPRTFKELGRDSGVRENEIRRFYKTVVQVVPQIAGGLKASAVNSVDMINRYSSMIGAPGGGGLPQYIRHLAQSIARSAKTLQLEGRSPASVASASILMACVSKNFPVKDKDIAKAACIHASTVRNCYNQMRLHESVLLPESSMKVEPS